MESKIMGFLSIKGWAGVVDIIVLVAIGTITGTFLIYYFLIYYKAPKPKQVSMTFLIIKAIIMATFLTMIISI